MSVLRLFPTQVWIAKPRFPAGWLDELVRECRIHRELDAEGRAWSREHYVAGYTSYSSIPNLHERSTTFELFRKTVDREVRRYARLLDVDLGRRALRMTSCWMNFMGRHCHHSFHLHPLNAISGTYYVNVPEGAGPFRIEDPRIACFMGSPPRRAKAREENRRYVELPVAPGMLLLFESWLKHEVPANHAREERLSISFNYEWS